MSSIGPKPASVKDARRSGPTATALFTRTCSGNRSSLRASSAVTARVFDGYFRVLAIRPSASWPLRRRRRDRCPCSARCERCPWDRNGRHRGRPKATGPHCCDSPGARPTAAKAVSSGRCPKVPSTTVTSGSSVSRATLHKEGAVAAGAAPHRSLRSPNRQKPARQLPHLPRQRPGPEGAPPLASRRAPKASRRLRPGPHLQPPPVPLGVDAVPIGRDRRGPSTRPANRFGAERWKHLPTSAPSIRSRQRRT